MKKLLCLTAMIITVLALHVSAYAADTALSFVTETLPDAATNAYYEQWITASGGDGNYTFSTPDLSDFPTGISLDADGRIWGTPTDAELTYCNMTIIVTDGQGNTAEKVFSLRIAATLVNFKITDYSFVYDDTEHRVTAVPYVNDKDVSAQVNNVRITYSGLESQKNAGKYLIQIEIKTPGYAYYSKDQSYMIIERNPNVTVTFGDTKTFYYDKNQQAPTILVTGKLTENPEKTVTLNNYTATYESTDGAGYYSVGTPPTQPGTYRVTCKLTGDDEKNFVSPETNNSTTFEILPNTVNFTLDDTSAFYSADAWEREFVPSNTAATDYTVKYVKGDTEFDAPTEPGVYTVKITFDEDSLYTLGTVTPSTITALQKPVKFTITNYSQEYSDEDLSPTIENDCGLTAPTDYTVEYYKDGENTTPHDVGEYTIVIDVKNKHYVKDYQNVTVFEIYAPKDKTEFTLGDGNSIFAKINAAGGDTDTAKQEFLDTYTYNEIKYPREAWADTNLDTDEKALFVYNGQTITLPTVSAVGSDGQPVPVESIKTVLETGSGEIDLTDQVEYTADLPCGIYTMRYSIEGNSVTGTRKVVVLWQLGDVNLDKNVNSIDGNYIENNTDIPESTADQKLFKYRVCDVTKNGKVDKDDRNAIYERMVTQIIEYYR